MNKYCDGQNLTDKEVKFLAMTSQELNRFLDKEVYQKYVNILCPEFIKQLEINITEQILEEYHKARLAVS